MRKSPTSAEQLLWDVLRRNTLGVNFRRQHPLGPYIADFVCLSRKLIIEVDGGVHEETEHMERDALREEYLKMRGLRVVRFRNDEVLSDLDRVIRQLEQVLAEQ